MKNSESRIEGSSSVVVDRTTGEKGERFNVSSIFWQSNNEVHVKGGHFASDTGGSGHTYTLRKKNGKWTVTKDQMNSMS